MTPTATAARSARTTEPLANRLKDASLLRDKCYIDGAWVGAGATPVTNPVDGVELAKVPRLGADETTKAVEAAERAFPAWSSTEPVERAKSHLHPHRSRAIAMPSSCRAAVSGGGAGRSSV